MKGLASAVAAILLAAPFAAWAQETYTTESTTNREEEARFRRFDLALNGGFGGYTGSVGADTVAGASYGVIGSLNQTRALSYELGYVGHSNGINDGSNGMISSNKLSVDFKAGPMLSGAMGWRPYAFAGLGVDFTGVSRNFSDIHGATMGVIPFGLGVDFLTHRTIHVGARATYDWTPGIGSDVTPNDPHPNGWQAALAAAAAF